MVVQEMSEPEKRADNVGVKRERKHRLKQRFEVRRKLGQGTYGKVQLAINKETGQEVAIKTIKKSKIDSDQDLMRIRREIQIMSSIQHPHIIHIFEVFENKDKIVLVMQFATGGELYEYVSERKVLNDNEARRIFRQVATAVYYCHKNKVCHRDLKLENILLDEKGNAKIGDFGLSNVFDEKHFLNTFCGSPLYASPEIVRGTPYYGPEVDCWSLGVLLYTLVYGAMPFDGSNFKRLVKQISEANYFEPKQKSDASALIRKLLAVNPAKRATIIDICTDWWVNKGYEHSLLQVAEDLANLTPVRLDLLLALAPVSPSATANDAAIAGQEQTPKKKKSKQKRHEASDESIPCESSTEISTELSTDILTCPEEEEEEQSVDNSSTIEFIPAAEAAALEEAYQNELSELNNKRQASASFDHSQSVTKIPSQVTKKKKPKKLQEDISPLLSIENQSSGYGSESTILSGKEVKQKSDSSPESNNSLIPITEPGEQLTPEKSETVVAVTKPENSRIENNEKLQSSLSSVKDDLPKTVSNNETCDVTKDTLEQKDVISDTAVRESSDVPSPKKAQLERKASFSGRTIGKVSIPKFIESKGETDKKPVPSYGSLADVKKAFQKRTDSIDKSKERVVPTFSVGDVKRAFERRTSLPAPPAPLWKNAGDRRQSEAFRTLTSTESPKNEPVKSISGDKSPVVSSTDKTVEEQQEIEDVNGTPKSEVNVGAEGSGKDLNVSLKAVTKEEIVEQKPSVEPQKSETVTVVKQSVDNENINEKNLESESSKSLSSLVRTQTSEEPLKTVSESKLIVNKKNEFPPKPLPPLKPKITPPVAAAESLPKISESVPSTPEIPASKAAPITRSYKKVTFTKDGACITETGKIISEKGADGMVTRVEKKSKVTHYPTSGASEGVTRTETKEETISSVEGSFDDDFKSGSLSPPIFGKPTVRRSESASSSGSTDIFDDIFDTWTGDPLFGNFSGKMRSLLQARSPFSNFMRKTNKKPKRRQRTESCERPVGDSATGFTRVGPNLTDHESDTDNEIDSPFSTNVGLWKFLNSNSPSSKFLERHRSMMSKHFGPDRDVFPEEFFSSSANRSLSRDRMGSVGSRVPQTPPASFRVVFGTPTTTRRVVATKQESFESSDGGTEGNTTPRASASASSSSRSTVKPLERNWSRQNSEQKSFEAGDFADDNSSRRRVEQWLDMNRQGIDIDENHPVSMYSTIRPRMFTRYGRTMSSRLGRDADEASRDETGSNVSYNTTHEYQMGADGNGRPPIRSFDTFDMPLRRTYSSSRPMVEMRLTFGGPSIAPIPVGSFISSSPAASSVSDSWESSVTLPETSSLLDQLRTHGYKNLVTQRLSGTKISEPKYNANENTPSGQYKRGKSVLSSSSKRMIVNGACIANGDCLDDTECMKTNRNDNCTSGKDSPVATSSSSATSSMTSAEIIKNLMDRRESSFEECFPATGASSEPVVLQMSEHRKTNLISNQSSNTLNRSVTNSANVDSTTKETVQERILRKSFYSRFNDDRPHHRASSKSRRRFSFVEGEDIDDLLSNFESAQYLRRSVKLPTSLPTTPSVTALSRKPPFLPISQTVNTSNDMFQRMKLKANRVFENMQNRQPFHNEHLSRTLNAEDFAAARRSFLMHRNSLIDGHFLEENNSRLNSEWPFDDENTFINSNQAFRTDHLSSAQKIRKEMEKLNRKANNE